MKINEIENFENIIKLKINNDEINKNQKMFLHYLYSIKLESLVLRYFSVKNY